MKSTRSKITLSEHEEAKLLAQYLELLKTQGKIVLYSHIPNETFTSSWNVKRKNKAEGVRPGVPDYIVVGRDGLLFIELKSKTGRVSLEQQHWLDSLNGASRDVIAHVAMGFDQAKQYLDFWIQ